MKAGVIKEGEKVSFGFHNFRHALATALVKQRVDAKTVQGILRHEDGAHGSWWCPLAGLVVLCGWLTSATALDTSDADHPPSN